MTKREMLAVRGRLASFLKHLLPLLGRRERRKLCSFYVQGLLLEGGRKTAAGMAQRFGGDEQALQQFVSQSPWDWVPLRKELAIRTARMAPGRPSWIVDDTGFPKQGTHSVGVHRQYCGTLGKVGNCQVGVSLNYGVDAGAFPLDFALYVPESWLTDERRAKGGIPSEVTFKKKWELALDMIDRAIEWGIPLGVLAADSAYGSVADFRLALQARQFPYAVAVGGDAKAWLSDVDVAPPPYSGMGRPRRKPKELPPAKSLRELARELPPDAWRQIAWREGVKGELKRRFATLRVRPAHGKRDGKEFEPVQWLLIQWPDHEPEPTNFWLSTLPDSTPVQELIRWAKSRWWIEQNYQHLKDELGLDHFEGRSWRGWHHHVTLTMMAFAFLVLEGYRSKKNFWVDPPEVPAGDASGLGGSAWLLPELREGASMT